MKKFTTTAIAVIAVAFATFAQPGSIDLNFNPNGLILSNGDGANGVVLTSSIQSDGKIIIGGWFTTYNGIARNRIARLNADGTLDGAFNPGTGASSPVNTISIQSDGKIIIGGNFSSYNGTARNRIARLNTDGTLDNTFNSSNGANNVVRTISIQSDGKIIIGGGFTSYNGTTRNRIARLNNNGTLDSTFNPGTAANNSVQTTSIQSDGKVIIGGDFTTFNGIGINRIARLNINGTLDSTFNPGSGTNVVVETTAIQWDGKIIIGGSFTTYDGTVRNRIARLNADGMLDSTFNPINGANNVVRTISMQEGAIIIGGDFTSYNGIVRNRIARLNTNGTLDNTFNIGTGANFNLLTTSIQSDGKIIIGGSFTTYNNNVRNYIARLNANGTLDDNFYAGTGSNNSVRTTSMQSDGKTIIGGSFTSYNGAARSCIARLNIDGTLDGNFNPGTGASSFQASVETTAIQNNGKIIIGGIFASYNGTPRNNIARLNTEGTLDGTFNPGTGVNGDVRTTSIQSDGKIIIGGGFTSYDGTARNNIARLNANGTLDGTFNTGAGANSVVFTTSIQSDGKIIIGGEFYSYNGTAVNRIARLNADGTLDGNFNPGTGANNLVFTTSIQSDGKILIGGSFTSYNGITRNGIVRLNTDGTIDVSFNPGSGVGSQDSVSTISLQSDGKIIIGGFFTDYNGTPRNRIARLNTNGTLDGTFNPGTGANSSVLTTSIQSDGKIIIGGWFTSYNGTGRNFIARIIGNAPLTTSLFEKNTVVIYPNPTNSKVFFDNSNYNFIEVAIYNHLGQEVAITSFNNNLKNQEIDMSNLATGVYVLRFYNATNSQSIKIIKQ
jgi:uncharacterized delta-60 repeat protein